MSQERRKKTARKNKFSEAEMSTMKNIVATLAMKRRPSDSDIAKEIYNQIRKTVTRRDIHYVKQRLIKEYEDEGKLIWKGITEKERDIVRTHLMAYQRVLNLGDDTEARKMFLGKGYDSATTIIDKNEDEFIDTGSLEKGWMNYDVPLEIKDRAIGDLQRVIDMLRAIIQNLRAG